MATVNDLIKIAQEQTSQEVVKTASENEMLKIASELADYDIETLEKLAAEADAKETEQSIELYKEADAFGRFMAHGYMGRIFELAANGR